MLLPHVSQGSLLTNEIRQFIIQRDWPKGLQIRLAEQPTMIRMYLFRDNLLSFDGEDMTQIANMLNEALGKLRADGVPIYLEVKPTKEDEIV